MNQDAVTVQRIHLERVIPAVRLFQALNLAISVQIFIPALVAIVVAEFAGHLLWPHPGSREMAFQGVSAVLPSPVMQMAGDACSLMQLGIRTDARTVISFLVNGLVLAVAGTAISRSAGRQYCLEVRTGAIRSIRDAIRRGKPLMTASLLAVVIPASICLCLHFTGWLAEATGIASVAPHAVWLWLWCLSCLCCVVTAVVGTGAILAVAAVGADECPGSDALSRGISYVLSHFTLAFIYAALVLVVAWGSGFVVESFGLLAAQLASRVVSESFLAEFLTAGTAIRQLPGMAGDMIADRTADDAGFPSWIIRCTASAVRLGVLFSGTTLTYLLLRLREDGVGLTELGDKDHRQPGSPMHQ